MTSTTPSLRPLQYSNDSPFLPASAPVNHPHLIDTTNWDESIMDLQNLRLADGILTLMYKWKPIAVNKFLDYAFYTHVIFTRSTREASELAKDLVIIRKGNYVHAGFLPKQAPKFNPQVTYTIEPNGEWTPVSLPQNDFANGFSADGVGGPDDVHTRGAKFAAAILSGKMWDSESGNMTMHSGLGKLML